MYSTSAICLNKWYLNTVFLNQPLQTSPAPPTLLRKLAEDKDGFRSKFQQ